MTSHFDYFIQVLTMQVTIVYVSRVLQAGATIHDVEQTYAEMASIQKSRAACFEQWERLLSMGGLDKTIHPKAFLGSFYNSVGAGKEEDLDDSMPDWMDEEEEPNDGHITDEDRDLPRPWSTRLDRTTEHDSNNIRTTSPRA